MTYRCGFCSWEPKFPFPSEGWIEAIQGFLDQQPHPTRVDGLIPCDRRVFEDDAFFCVVASEPLAEGHIRLICKHHLTDIGQLRGITSEDVDGAAVETVRSNLLDNLIIAHDVARNYDERVTHAIMMSGTSKDVHMYADVVPVYRFDHGTLHTLGERGAVWEDMSLEEKRDRWKRQANDYAETAQCLREVAGRVIRSRPGRRRAGLVAGDEMG
ncbi:MAG: hypothetical protein JSW25_04350 [Thermoplasmata archaeon]|nr:MAG: hypothetical protein JSW25_04350 [Thermoplasmata archaeon]